MGGPAPSVTAKLGFAAGPERGPALNPARGRLGLVLGFVLLGEGLSWVGAELGAGHQDWPRSQLRGDTADPRAKHWKTLLDPTNFWGF